MTFRHVLIASAAAATLAAVGCSRDKPGVADSELTHDLALANQTPVIPQFNDTAMSAAAAPAARTVSKPRTPAPRPTPTSRPPARRRAPTPVQRRVEPSPRAPLPIETPVPSPAPARGRGIAAGTSFGLVTNSRVCTTNLPGDKLTARLTSAVRGDNGAVIPEGTTVVLEVASVTPGDRPEDAQIALRVRAIVLNDEPVGVDGDVAVVSDLERRQVPGDKNSDRRKVVGGAIAGAILGQILGKDTRSTVIGAAAGGAAGAVAAAASRKYEACLPAGGSVRVTTSQPIALGG